MTKFSKNWGSLPVKEGLRGAVFGSFDGLHLGHNALLDQLINWKKNNKTAHTWLISLYPHPSHVLKKSKTAKLLRLNQELELLNNIGIDCLHLLKFSKDVSNWSADFFIEKAFINFFNLDLLIIGQDARVGKGGVADCNYIKKKLEGAGKQVIIVPEKQVNGVKIGSRYIRATIEAGDIATAENLLGRPFTIFNKVIHGDKRGQKLGFRTANLSLSPYVIPDFGVYLVKVVLDNQSYQGVANIGIRPTFQGTKPLLEVHLFNYAGRDFYGKKISVALLQRLRSERKFNNIEELKSQIASDIVTAQNYFKSL
jgi:riboflavin kinase/FMN adenylyltransferase